MDYTMGQVPTVAPVQPSIMGATRDLKETQELQCLAQLLAIGRMSIRQAAV